jgi:hypothetical protein
MHIPQSWQRWIIFATDAAKATIFAVIGILFSRHRGLQYRNGRRKKNIAVDTALAVLKEDKIKNEMFPAYRQISHVCQAADIEWYAGWMPHIIHCFAELSG